MTVTSVDSSTSPKAVVLFSHGAGVGHGSGFMKTMTELLQVKGFYVEPFTFGYMQQAEETGKKRPALKAEKLIPELFQGVVEIIKSPVYEGLPVYLLGKSMGGRVSTLLCEQLGDNPDESLVDLSQLAEVKARVKSALVLGYPFHPIGKPDKLRVSHLPNSGVPLHIMQGCRDTMGTYDEVMSYTLPELLSLYWFEDANHDLKPRKASGFTQQDHLESAACLIEGIISEGI